jgi:hypothetical protein
MNTILYGDVYGVQWQNRIICQAYLFREYTDFARTMKANLELPLLSRKIIAGSFGPIVFLEVPSWSKIYAVEMFTSAS